MPIIQGTNQSTIKVDKNGLTIRLPSQVFGKGWLRLLSRLLATIIGHTIIPFCQRIMSQPEAQDEAPRWIESQIDGLSWLLFLLKVPKEHELVRLWYVIDWQEINRLASPYYKNAHGGRPAWAPAQLTAILILMFLYGVPHETTAVRGIKENIVWCWFCGFTLFGPFPAHDALYEFRKRVGKECFEKILTLAVKGCMDGGLVDNKLVHFDLTPTEASAHRWSPYERAVIVTGALIRYLELVWAEQTPQEPTKDTLKTLAAEVALATLPHKGLKNVKPERVLESVEDWQQKAAKSNPIWQEASQQLVEELLNEPSPLRNHNRLSQTCFSCSFSMIEEEEQVGTISEESSTSAIAFGQKVENQIATQTEGEQASLLKTTSSMPQIPTQVCSILAQEPDVNTGPVYKVSVVEQVSQSGPQKKSLISSRCTKCQSLRWQLQVRHKKVMSKQKERITKCQWLGFQVCHKKIALLM